MELVKNKSILKKELSITEIKKIKCLLAHSWVLKETVYQEYYTKDCNYKYGLKLIEIKKCNKCNKEKVSVKEDKKFVFLRDRDKEKENLLMQGKNK